MIRVILKDRGQVTIPAKVRKSLRLRSGDVLEVRVSNGDIVLKPLDLVARPAEPDDAPEGPAP